MSRKVAFLALTLAATATLAQPNANDAASVDWSNAQAIEITMTNYNFAPNMLQLRRNTPYRLHLVNNGSSGHSFASKELFAAAMVAPADRAKIKDGEVDVPKGTSVDVLVLPLTAGSFAFRCTHFLHAGFGMRGQATVGE